MCDVKLQTISRGRRQARFLHDQVVVPTGVRTDAWYDVCTGRRRDDRRTGMVLLNLGDTRMLVPNNCLEFRARPARRPVFTGSNVAVAASVCMAALAIGSFTLDR
jgi:hypothetical protein